MWDIFTYPFQNFNGTTIEVWEWISTSISHFMGIWLLVHAGNKVNSLRLSDSYICVGKLTIIGSDNGLLPQRRQAIIWTNTGILLIGPLGTNFSEILIRIQAFSFKKMHLKMPSAKWRLFRLGLNVLIYVSERGATIVESDVIITLFNITLYRLQQSSY